MSTRLSKSSPQNCPDPVSTNITFTDRTNSSVQSFKIYAVLSLSSKPFFIWAVDTHSYDLQSSVGIVGVIYEHPLLSHNTDLMSYPTLLDRRYIGKVLWLFRGDRAKIRQYKVARGRSGICFQVDVHCCHKKMRKLTGQIERMQQ